MDLIIIVGGWGGWGLNVISLFLWFLSTVGHIKWKIVDDLEVVVVCSIENHIKRQGES